MKLIIRVVLVVVLSSLFSFARVVEFETIDATKQIVQIGTYSKQKTVQRIQKKLEDTQDIYIRKEPKFTVIYVVNLPKSKRKKILLQLRKKYKDAFIQKKAYDVIKKYTLKTKKKAFKPTRQKEIPKIKKQESPKVMSKKVAIQIGTYSKQTTVNRIKKELEGKRDIYIKKGKKYTVIYVVNIPNKERKKVLQSLRKKYKGAFISKKFYKKTQKNMAKTQLTELETIELLERLYKEGLNNFNEKKYLKSYKLFKQIFKVDMKNMDVNFYLARSAYEISKYEEALDIYNYMLFRDPDNKQLKLEVGKTYNKLEKYEKAKKYFSESYK